MSDIKDLKIEDFGEKIGGARKDTWAGRGLNLDDLLSMDEREYAKYIIKDNVWPTPNYVELVEKEGMTPGCAYYLKYFRDSIPAKPLTQSKKSCEDYIRFVDIYKAVGLSLRTISDVIGIDSKLAREGEKQGFPYIRTGSYYNIMKKVRVAYSYELESYDIEARIQNFPYEFKGAYKGITVTKFGNEPNYYYRVRGKGIYDANRYNSVDEAINAIETIHKPKIDGEKKEKKEKSKHLVRPQLQGITRKGLDIRSKDISGDDLLEVFKFRGGEFGNWNTQGDRQAFLNYAYDGLYDLATVLNCPTDFISLGGYKDKKLAIAFGARGTGGSGAVAHYEPANVVINLTKLKGAGSLAHEWAHALDDYLGIKCTGTSFLTNNYRSKSGRDGDYAAICEKMEELIEVMNHRYLTEEEINKSIENMNAKYIRAIRNLLQPESTFRRGDVSQQAELKAAYDKVMEELTEASFEHFCNERKRITNRLPEKSVRDNISNYLRFIGYNKESDSTENKTRFPKGDSNYLKGAKNLDKSRSDGYYESRVEMFARAFESYVEDKLHEYGYLSEYLVHATTNNYYPEFEPYPTGDERTLINSKMEEFLKLVVETFSEYKPSTLVSIKEIETKKLEKFLLTKFKGLSKDKGLNPNMGQTRTKGSKYIIDFECEVLNNVIVSKYINLDTDNELDITLLSDKIEKFTWFGELDYTLLVSRLLELKDKYSDDEKEKILEESNKLLNSSDSLLKNTPKLGELVVNDELSEIRNYFKEQGYSITPKVGKILKLFVILEKGKMEKYKEEGTPKNFKLAVDINAVKNTISVDKLKSIKREDLVQFGIYVDISELTKSLDGILIAKNGLVYGESKYWMPKGAEKVVEMPVMTSPTIDLKEIDVNETKDLRKELVRLSKLEFETFKVTPTFLGVYNKVLYNITLKSGANVLNIIQRPLSAETLRGKSKAYAISKDKSVLAISHSVEDKKKIEGLIEGLVDILLPEMASPKQKLMIKEGVVYMICKSYNLDVRTYCIDKNFETLVSKSKVSVKNYTASVLEYYKKYIEYFK